jgi:DNA invertase Pin-like site-specific DNA recombinase
LKVAIYARYSSDNQRDASIADQLRVCREFAVRQGWMVVEEFTDHAISGATLLRSGFQALMRDALNQRFDVVLAEALDRFSRDQEDTAGLFKRLTFAGVNIVTLAEGDITHLHVGFKGTMNALFLKDLADKTRRGLRGRVELGKSGGGLCYGYRVTHATHEGLAVTGDREIVPGDAELIRRIFQDYAAGLSPKAIAKRLNAERRSGPGGAPWNPSTIHGNPARGTGILNNELYVGRLVWNRLRYIKDPDTGKRVSRPNAPSEWVTTVVPDLRIVDDELWNEVKARQAEMRRVASSGDPKRFNQARRPKYLFSGLTKCAECGGGYVMYWRDRLACFGARSRGTCTNRLTISRQEVEERVLVALREKLMRRDLFEDFCREYVRELNRLRMEHRASLTQGRAELARVEREIRKFIQAIKDGVPALSIKDELLSLEARKGELQSRLEAPEMPELLHPRMADVYREKVGNLCLALESEQSRTAAADAIRALVEAILLEPDGDQLKITLRGDLAGMLSAARDSKRSPDTGDLLVQIKLVAGAGFEPASSGYQLHEPVPPRAISCSATPADPIG